MLAFLALLGAPYIYDISSLRVKCWISDKPWKQKIANLSTWNKLLHVKKLLEMLVVAEHPAVLTPHHQAITCLVLSKTSVTKALFQ